MWLVCNNKGFIYKEENSGSGFWDTQEISLGCLCSSLEDLLEQLWTGPSERSLVVLWWWCHICHHNPDLGHFHWSSPATCLSPEPPLASHASTLAATHSPPCCRTMGSFKSTVEMELHGLEHLKRTFVTQPHPYHLFLFSVEYSCQ